MHRSALLLAALVLLPLSPHAAESGIRFDAQVSRDGEVIASPSVWTAFGQPIIVEVPGLVKFEAVAAAPVGDRSEVAAKLYYHDGKAWVLSREASMAAAIAQTPSFEQTFPAGGLRLVLMPRKADSPAGR